MIIFANLFVPISVGLGEKDSIKIRKNEASAATVGIKMTSSSNVNGSDIITVTVNVTWSSGLVGVSGTSEGARITLSDPAGVRTPIVKIITLTRVPGTTDSETGSYTFSSSDGLTPSTQYDILSEARQIDMGVYDATLGVWVNAMLPNKWGLWTLTDDQIKLYMSQGTLGVVTTHELVSTLAKDDTTVIKGKTLTTQNAQFGGGLPSCGIDVGVDIGIPDGTVSGCLAQILYYGLFVPTSYLFALSGTFFDNTFSYSVQSSSYKSSFVVQGWGLVRDFCNMFFIFIMLYIAISTILNLHGFNTKSTIINVIVIGLFINFSLFATQVIIDSSNIMARVFYNSDAIKITEKGIDGATNVVSAIGPDGIIPLSAALVNKVNPQNIIINSAKVGQISDLGGKSTSVDLGAGTFILITLLAVGINIVGFVIFLSIGLVFVVRVVGLWIAMILSPLAFFTYILPEQMAGWKMVGWKNWWPETLKMAFMAPIFIFFLYIILKFLELDLISNSSGKTGIPFVISTMIPFAFIMVLMMKAKKIAVDMSGEMGNAVSKIGGVASGLVLGGAVGLGATAMRKTIGGLGSKIANSKTVASWENKGYFGARSLRNIGTKASTGSFDIRNTKAGALAGSSLGADLGKGEVGGYKKAEADRIAKRTQRLEELKNVSTHEDQVKKRKVDVAKKILEDNNAEEIHDIEAQLTVARQKIKDVAVDRTEGSEYMLAIEKISELNNKLGDIKSGKNIEGEINEDGTNRYNSDNGRITKTEYDDIAEKAREEAEVANEKFNKAEIVRGGNGIPGSADVAEGIAKAKAEEEKNEAIKVANDGKENTIRQAEKSEAEAIEDAERKLLEATKLSTKAVNDLKNTRNTDPNYVNIRNTANAARAAEEKARIDVSAVTANAKTATSRATTIAGENYTNAVKAATERYNNTFIKAEEDKKSTIEEAEKASAEAISKSSESQAKLIKAQSDAKNGFGRSIKELNKESIHGQLKIDQAGNEVAKQYVEAVNSKWNKMANMFSEGDTKRGRDEATDKMLLNMVVKNTENHSSGGGGHQAATKEAPHKEEKHDKPSAGGGSGHGH